MNSADKTWIESLDSCLKNGSSSSPRGMGIIENICFKSSVDMNEPIILNKKRKLSYKFMAGEAAWILSGDNKLENIAKYNSVMSSFSDDGIYLRGAYGPPIAEQLSYISDCLIEDRDSRQAVISIWRPNPRKSKDIPCTVSTQFIIRKNKLSLVNYMRSSDLWLGLPYDVFTFSMLARYLICVMNKKSKSNNKIELGELHIVAGSSHIYSQHIEKARQIVESDSNKLEDPNLFYENITIPSFENESDIVTWLKQKADENSLITK